MKANDKAHLSIAAVLFLTWVVLVVAKVPGCEDLIAYIKLGLGTVTASHGFNKVRRSVAGQAAIAPISAASAIAAPTSSADASSTAS